MQARIRPGDQNSDHQGIGHKEANPRRPAGDDSFRHADPRGTVANAQGLESCSSLTSGASTQGLRLRRRASARWSNIASAPGLENVHSGDGQRAMAGTNEKLTAAVEDYFSDLRKIRSSGGATGERSYYPPLTNLLNAVGRTLKPKVFCVSELAQQGAGHPDLGLYAAKQMQRGRQRDGQLPEGGVV